MDNDASVVFGASGIGASAAGVTNTAGDEHALAAGEIGDQPWDVGGGSGTGDCGGGGGVCCARTAAGSCSAGGGPSGTRTRRPGSGDHNVEMLRGDEDSSSAASSSSTLARSLARSCMPAPRRRDRASVTGVRCGRAPRGASKRGRGTGASLFVSDRTQGKRPVVIDQGDGTALERDGQVLHHTHRRGGAACAHVVVRGLGNSRGALWNCSQGFPARSRRSM